MLYISLGITLLLVSFAIPWYSNEIHPLLHCSTLQAVLLVLWEGRRGNEEALAALGGARTVGRLDERTMSASIVMVLVIMFLGCFLV